MERDGGRRGGRITCTGERERVSEWVSGSVNGLVDNVSQ